MNLHIMSESTDPRDFLNYFLDADNRFALIGLLVTLNERYFKNRIEYQDEILGMIQSIIKPTDFSKNLNQILLRSNVLIQLSGKWDTMGDIPYILTRYSSLKLED